MISLIEAWSHLRQTKAQEPGWHFRRLDPAQPNGILAGIRRPGEMPGLLLEVPASAIDQVAEYPQSQGFRLEPEIISPGDGGTVRLCLELADRVHEDVFSVLADDVASAVSVTIHPEEAVAAFLQRLFIWQVFMRRLEAGGLGRLGIIGLYGELIVIEQLISAGLKPRSVLEAWRGPLDGLRDFEFGAAAIEVKATSRTPPVSISVNGLAQLDEASVRHLLLILVALAEDQVAGRSLSQLIGVLRELVESIDQSAVPIFGDLLIQAGYIDNLMDDSDLMDRLMFRVNSMDAFRVEGDFPRLTAADVPVGVIDCRYEIQVAALAPFKVPQDMVMESLG